MILQTASPRGRQTDRQATPVCLSHASLTVVCSTNLGVQQGNYTARIDNRSLGMDSGRKVRDQQTSQWNSFTYRITVGQSASQSCIKSNLDTAGTRTDCMRNLEP
jgi:hypothetical protein